MAEPSCGAPVGAGLRRCRPGMMLDETDEEGADMRKALLLLGVLGLVIGVVLYLRGRQGGDLELEY